MRLVVAQRVANRWSISWTRKPTGSVESWPVIGRSSLCICRIARATEGENFSLQKPVAGANSRTMHESGERAYRLPPPPGAAIAPVLTPLPALCCPVRLCSRDAVSANERRRSFSHEAFCFVRL